VIVADANLLAYLLVDGPLTVQADRNMVEQSKCTTYDLEYVWLARELDLPLVTAEAEILKAYPDVAIGIEQYAT
jgi:hypothetical protein